MQEADKRESKPGSILRKLRELPLDELFIPNHLFNVPGPGKYTDNPKIIKNLKTCFL